MARPSDNPIRELKACSPTQLSSNGTWIGLWMAHTRLIIQRRQASDIHVLADCPSANEAATSVAPATSQSSQRSFAPHLSSGASPLICAHSLPQNRHRRAFARRCPSQQSTLLIHKANALLVERDFTNHRFQGRPITCHPQ